MGGERPQKPIAIGDFERETARARPPHRLNDVVRQIAESDTFRTAPAMRALLLYLWAHAGEPISEYGIATEALGRNPEFDPRTDSTVRVHIARLRTKLKEFYEAAGDGFPLRLNLPLGSHELQWVYQPEQRSVRQGLNAIPRNYVWIAAGTAAVLIAICVGLLFEVMSLQRALPLSTSALPRFWQSFLVAGRATTIVVPSPLHFGWPAHQIFVRDFAISEFSDWPKSEVVNGIAQKWGPPELSQSYVGAMEMNSAVRLLQYLETRNQQVHLIESRRFPAESFAAQNTIFLGMPRTAGYLNQMLDKTNFYLAGVNADVVRNRHPLAGEPAEYREVSYASDRRRAPAIITLLPERAERTRMLLLLGRNLTSVASLVLTPEGLRQLDEQWARAGSPGSWEMVIEAEIYRDTVLRVSPVSCRAIASGFWQQDGK